MVAATSATSIATAATAATSFTTILGMLHHVHIDASKSADVHSLVGCLYTSINTTCASTGVGVLARISRSDDGTTSTILVYMFCNCILMCGI